MTLMSSRGSFRGRRESDGGHRGRREPLKFNLVHSYGERLALPGIDAKAGRAQRMNVTSERIVVVGLGYVGLPLAVALARKFSVLGFDLDRSRVTELVRGSDRTGEVDCRELSSSTLEYTSVAQDGYGASIYIVTVPTPVDSKNRPDLRPLIDASRTIGGLLDASQKPVIVFESTVYPGVTEDICGPLLEGASGLVRGRDFFLGYSPERINPGDRTHTVDRIVKVVAGENPAVTERLACIYGAITHVFRAASIKVAEAAKVIENAQRDINIAFMNEITQIFASVEISVWDVLDAARTKWNFLAFEPGLVGGHCIGVDPYYLSYRAQQLGHEPQIILAGRATNDGMGAWVAERLHLARDHQPGSVLILGLTFKENVPDLRNSRVIDVIRRLEELGHTTTTHDPRANAEAASSEYGISLEPDALRKRYDIVLLAVPHAEFQAMTTEEICTLVTVQGTVADLKGAWRERRFPKNIKRWAL